MKLIELKDPVIDILYDNKIYRQTAFEFRSYIFFNIRRALTRFTNSYNL